MTRSITSLFILTLLIAGCNTMEGLGRDVKKTGESLEQTAHKNKPKSTPHERFSLFPD